jgi:ribosomal protein S18 acetylase RimI-like enzyme
MYVATGARGRGYARTLLAHLEATARQAGARWLLLETGRRQPEAVQLYLSCGYQPVPPFGHYAETELSIHLGKDLLTASAPHSAAGRPRSARPGR